MSKNKRESNTLPPLQRLIVIHLSKTGPQTINETVKKIKHSYKPSWIAFTNLEKKGIIRKGKMKEYRNQKYPLFWLTEEGVIAALTEGVSSTDLLEVTKQIYPDKQMLTLALEMAPYLNPNIFKIALTTLKTKGKLEPTDLISIMIMQMQIDTPMTAFIQALQILRSHPKEYEQFKQKITQTRENFSKLSEII